MENDQQQSIEEKTNCRTVFLGDNPADKDAFGAHERVAKAIANMIKGNNGCKAIALKGSWGSGKSTVVGFIKKILDEDNIVFIYDAWNHQGDPLRKSFIEALTNYFKEKEVLDGEKSDELQMKFEKRQDTTETHSRSFTLSEKIIAICVFFLPIGYVLLSKFTDKLFDIPFCEDYYFPAWILGLLIVLLPLIVVFIKYIYSRENVEINKLISLLFKEKNANDSFAVTMRSPDPTSVEFNKTFKEIMNSIFEKNNNSKVLLVIDNLDRVSTDEALNIWATMRTFFEPNTNVNLPWMDNFWLLVPFDNNAPDRLWNSAQYERDETKPNDEKNKSLNENLNKSLAEAFENKTFQTVYHVPPPLLTKWKDYLFENLRKAIPDHDVDDFHDVYRLFQIEGIASKRAPTPREIKLFINRICSLHQVWGDKIELKYQALYACCHARIEETTDLIKDDLIRDDTKRIVGNIYKEKLAALHLNLEPEDAIEAIISPDIKDAIIKGDDSKLKELEDISCFYDLCEHCLESELRGWRNTPDSNFIAAASFYSVKSKQCESYSRIIDTLKGNVLDYIGNIKLNKLRGRGIVSIFKHSNNKEEFIVRVLIGLTKNDSYYKVLQNESSEEEHLTENVKDLVDGLLFLFCNIEESYEELIKEHFRVNTSCEVYIKIMEVLAEKNIDQRIVKYFKFNGESNDVVQELNKICSDGRFNKSLANALELMFRLENDWPWDKLIPKLFEQINKQDQDLSIEDVKGCIITLINLSKIMKIEQAKNNLEKLINKNTLFQFLDQPKKENDYELAALCIFSIISFNPNPETADNTRGKDFYLKFLTDPNIKNNKHKNIISYLIDLINKYGFIENLFDLREKQLVKIIIEDIINKEDYPSNINEIIMKKFRSIKEIKDMDTEEIINKLVVNNDLVNDLMSTEFCEDMADLYTPCFQFCTSEEKTTYSKYLLEGLRSINKDVWLTNFRNNESNLLDMVLSLTDDGQELNLGDAYKEALKEHAKELNFDKNNIGKYHEQWDKIINALKNDYKMTLLRDIKFHLITDSNQNISSVLSLYGSVLKNSGIIFENNHIDDVVRKLFFEIIERKRSEEIKWVTSCFEKYPALLNDASTETENVFIDKLRKSMNEAESEELKGYMQTILEINNNS